MRAILLGIFLIGCGDNRADKVAACELGTARSASSVENRRVIGIGAPYVADLTLAARDEELQTSIASRRTAAWNVVEKVLAPVPLGDPRLAQNFGGDQPKIPTWHTWYAQEDFTRTFKHLYRDLGPASRRARAPIDGAAGLAWNATAVDAIWPEQRYLDYLARIDSQNEVDGLGGATRVGYSPATTEHLLESYTKMHACRLTTDPAAVDPDAMREGSMVTEHESITVERCEFRVLGPFVAAPGVEVEVTTTGDGDGDVYVRRGAAPDLSTYDCKSDGDASDEACVVDGGDAIYVAVIGAGNDPSTVELDITYRTMDVANPTCLDGPMPRDAVLVKSDWRRVIDGELLPVFDTSASRMTTRLAGDATWNSDGGADPKANSIYTVTLPVETGEPVQTFRLPALHVMTKELDHWLWITLWWSQTPDLDFGADRPASIAAMPIWKNYKMCVSSGYVERDPDLHGGASSGPGSLGDAIAAVHGGVGTPSWCSNPYIEGGMGNAGTNCIGCHQHGGTATTAEDVLMSQPHHGATRVRNNFFTDYLWAIKGGGGDDLSSYVQAEVDYWDANDP